MEGVGYSSVTDHQTTITSFLEIAVGQTADTARQFLQATGWKLEEAIQLFYVGTEVHAPLPVKSDVLYDSPMMYSFDEEFKLPEVWEADRGSTSAAAAAEASGDNLAALYRAPFALMYHGPFQKAKEAAKGQDRWLLVNVQSTKEFNSHMLNRDTWGNETVAQTITSNFIFWQICDDTEEGCKIISYYKLDSVPVTLVIDPITGQKMRLWRGMVQPDSLLEDVLQFMDSSPVNHLFSSSHRRRTESSHVSSSKIQDETNEDDNEMAIMVDISEGVLNDSDDIEEVSNKGKVNYPPLPEEPKGDRSLLCRVAVRLPDGSRVQRSFLRSDPIQLLWSFCAAKCCDEKAFRLTHAIPGAVKDMDYEKMSTFDDSGVANSMISVTWE